jgi:hypothetical protein
MIHSFLHHIPIQYIDSLPLFTSIPFKSHNELIKHSRSLNSPIFSNKESLSSTLQLPLILSIFFDFSSPSVFQNSGQWPPVSLQTFPTVDSFFPDSILYKHSLSAITGVPQTLFGSFAAAAIVAFTL